MPLLYSPNETTPLIGY